MALVFNPKTAKISPQYHVVFGNDFTTVPYMEQGEVPPNWEVLHCLSKESATDESFDRGSGRGDLTGWAKILVKNLTLEVLV
jgi:hypothetical protein